MIIRCFVLKECSRYSKYEWHLNIICKNTRSIKKYFQQNVFLLLTYLSLFFYLIKSLNYYFKHIHISFTDKDLSPKILNVHYIIKFKKIKRASKSPHKQKWAW